MNNRDATMTPLTSMYLLCLESSSPTQEEESLVSSNMNFFLSYFVSIKYHSAAMILQTFIS